MGAYSLGPHQLAKLNDLISQCELPGKRMQEFVYFLRYCGAAS